MRNAIHGFVAQRSNFHHDVRSRWTRPASDLEWSRRNAFAHFLCSIHAGNAELPKSLLRMQAMSRNVLVIEDDNDIAQLVRMQLANLACRTTVLNDGRAGVAEAPARPYDLVVLDLMLPGV
ncbi:UNVERIFIED_ORG: response regulator receiver domain-containing protein [Burkholderia sp. CF145]